MESSINLSHNLRALRGARSLEEFAKELGIAKSTLENIEKQKNSTRVSTVDEICKRLGIPVSLMLSNDLKAEHLVTLQELLRQFSWFADLSAAEQVQFVHSLRDLMKIMTQNPNLWEEHVP